MGGVIGTGVAAGVAQSAQQAQQLARQRDKQVRDARRLADRQLEIQRVQLEGLTELDAAEQATGIHIDNQVPEHEHRELPESRRRREEDADAAGRFPYMDRAELLSRLPLTVDTSKLTAARAEPQSVAAAAYQHHAPERDAAANARLDLEG